MIFTEASLGVEAVGRLGRTEGIVAGTTGTMEVSWGVETVGAEGTIGTIAGGTTVGRIEGITGRGAITFVFTLTK